jgi:hypothetical protein
VVSNLSIYQCFPLSLPKNVIRGWARWVGSTACKKHRTTLLSGLSVYPYWLALGDGDDDGAGSEGGIERLLLYEAYAMLIDLFAGCWPYWATRQCDGTGSEDGTGWDGNGHF